MGGRDCGKLPGREARARGAEVRFEGEEQRRGGGNRSGPRRGEGHD